GSTPPARRPTAIPVEPGLRSAHEDVTGDGPVRAFRRAIDRGKGLRECPTGGAGSENSNRSRPIATGTKRDRRRQLARGPTSWRPWRIRTSNQQVEVECRIGSAGG